MGSHGKGQALYERARRLIPGGTQLLSKRPELFHPTLWPTYYQSATGPQVVDLDGRRLVDMSYNGIGSCILGYSDPDVNAAVTAAVDKGSMATLNCPEEVELAELLCDLHPFAAMVRYARSGGEAMAIAVRIARASTGRDEVAFCGYHGWHDWYLAANLRGDDPLGDHLLTGLSPRGVPRALKGTVHAYRYNDLDAVQEIVDQHGTNLAAIVMEPIRGEDPEPGFLQGVRHLAHSCGAVLIFDEITSGFRMFTGGHHLDFDVEPDIAVFAKAIGNGFPMAAIIGCETVMKVAATTFISSTYWSERIGPAAALATIEKHRARDVGVHVSRIGNDVKQVWREAAARASLTVKVEGTSALPHFAIQTEQEQAATSLFTERMLDYGFLAGKAFYATYAHKDEHIEDYRAAVNDVFPEIASAIEKNSLLEELSGPPAQTGFKRLTS